MQLSSEFFEPAVLFAPINERVSGTAALLGFRLGLSTKTTADPIGFENSPCPCWTPLLAFADKTIVSNLRCRRWFTPRFSFARHLALLSTRRSRRRRYDPHRSSCSLARPSYSPQPGSTSCPTNNAEASLPTGRSSGGPRYPGTLRRQACRLGL